MAIKREKEKERERASKPEWQMANSIYYQHILVLSTSIVCYLGLREKRE